MGPFTDYHTRMLSPVAFRKRKINHHILQPYTIGRSSHSIFQDPLKWLQKSPYSTRRTWRTEYTNLTAAKTLELPTLST
jgi:hypothetical protein